MSRKPWGSVALGLLLVPGAMLGWSFAVIHSASAAREYQRVLRRTSILLCATEAAGVSAMQRDRTLVERRVRRGFGFAAAHVTLSGASCIKVVLPHPIRWLGWLADDISGVGRFGIGETEPSPRQRLLPGTVVRYKNDPITQLNAREAVVKVVIGRPGLKGWSAKIASRNGFIYVGIDLTGSGSSTLCRFTKSNIGGLAAVVLDRRLISDETISVRICGGSLLTGFPKRRPLDRPLGPREVVADLHSGLLPVALDVTSVR